MGRYHSEAGPCVQLQSLPLESLNHVFYSIDTDLVKIIQISKRLQWHNCNFGYIFSLSLNFKGELQSVKALMAN